MALNPYEMEQPALLTYIEELFGDNSSEEITPEDARNGFNALIYSAVLKQGGTLSVNQLRGGTHIKATLAGLHAIPDRLRVLGMSCIVANPAGPAELAAGVILAPVTFVLVRDSAGTYDAFVDADSATVTKATWVLSSGSEEDKIASYPVFIEEDHTYRKDDPIQYTFASGAVRLFRARKDLLGYINPAPTGLDNDPNWISFAPLSGNTLTAAEAVSAVLQQLGRGLKRFDVDGINDVQLGDWWVHSTGIWQARRAMKASAAPVAGANWELVFAGGGSDGNFNYTEFEGFAYDDNDNPIPATFTKDAVYKVGDEFLRATQTRTTDEYPEPGAYFDYVDVAPLSYLQQQLAIERTMHPWFIDYPRTLVVQGGGSLAGDRFRAFGTRPYRTVTEAYNNAQAGDTIVIVAGGSATLNGRPAYAENITFQKDNLTLVGIGMPQVSGSWNFGAQGSSGLRRMDVIGLRFEGVQSATNNVSYDSLVRFEGCEFGPNSYFAKGRYSNQNETLHTVLFDRCQIDYARNDGGFLRFAEYYDYPSQTHIRFLDSRLSSVTASVVTGGFRGGAAAVGVYGSRVKLQGTTTVKLLSAQPFGAAIVTPGGQEWPEAEWLDDEREGGGGGGTADLSNYYTKGQSDARYAPFGAAGGAGGWAPVPVGYTGQIAPVTHNAYFFDTLATTVFNGGQPYQIQTDFGFEYTRFWEYRPVGDAHSYRPVFCQQRIDVYSVRRGDYRAFTFNVRRASDNTIVATQDFNQYADTFQFHGWPDRETPSLRFLLPEAGVYYVEFIFTQGNGGPYQVAPIVKYF